MVSVICIKWGTAYPASYVNRLCRMVAANLTQPHRFVCFTDAAAGLDSGIESRPIPDAHWPKGPERFWRKLSLLSNPLADLSGTILYFDLDVVIVGKLDRFFEHPGKFCIIREWRPGEPRGNSSVLRFEAGAHADVLAEFLRDPAAVEAQYIFDQDFMSARIKPLTFWPETWCRSFKKHCLPRVPRCYFRRPAVPEDASVIVFHGHPKPEQALHGCLVRGGIKYCRATPWIREFWEANKNPAQGTNR